MSKSANFRKQCPKFPKVKMLVLLLTRLVEKQSSHIMYGSSKMPK